MKNEKINDGFRKGFHHLKHYSNFNHFIYLLVYIVIKENNQF